MSDELDDDLDLDIDIDLDDEDGDGDGDKENGKAKAGKKKKIIIIASVVLLLLIGGGGGAAWFLMGPPSKQKSAELDLGQPVSVDMPVVRTDLKTGACRAPFVKFEFSVQLSSNDVELLNAVQPQVMDSIRTHLRDQERQDLVGKQGTLQLKSDLAAIINNMIRPAQVRGILFKDLLLQ